MGEFTESNGNKNCIYFGFDGSTTNSFKTLSQNGGKSLKEISSGNINVDNTFNVYQIEWLSDSVTWKFNGNVVRTFTDKTEIPQTSMDLKIHSRSSNYAEMPKNGSLY